MIELIGTLRIFQKPPQLHTHRTRKPDVGRRSLRASQEDQPANNSGYETHR